MKWIVSMNSDSCDVCFPRFLVSFRYQGQLQAIAALCSKAIFGGIPFRHGDGCCDEFPAMRLSADFLSIVITLWKEPERFFLEGTGSSTIGYPAETDFKSLAIKYIADFRLGDEVKHGDIGEYVCAHLRRIPGIDDAQSIPTIRMNRDS